MRHRRSGRKLGRDASHRKALYANLASALIEHGRIKTTAAKAKEVKPIAEQMITLGKRGGVHARRQALAYLRSQDVVHKLFSDVGPRFADFLPEPPAPRRSRAEREEEPVEVEAGA
jgi:large subunit ribosomal protein L17